MCLWAMARNRLTPNVVYLSSYYFDSAAYTCTCLTASIIYLQQFMHFSAKHNWYILLVQFEICPFEHPLAFQTLCTLCLKASPKMIN